MSTAIPTVFLKSIEGRKAKRESKKMFILTRQSSAEDPPKSKGNTEDNR
jgi:hypothetical protein